MSTHGYKFRKKKICGNKIRVVLIFSENLDWATPIIAVDS